jgi:hypothetical protein
LQVDDLEMGDDINKNILNVSAAKNIKNTDQINLKKASNSLWG